MVAATEFALDLDYLERMAESPKRRPTAIDDFGDEATIGLHLKRKGRDDVQRDFGLYLGEHHGLWIVGIKHCTWWTGGCGRLTRLESYGSLERLKRLWELD